MIIYALSQRTISFLSPSAKRFEPLCGQRAQKFMCAPLEPRFALVRAGFDHVPKITELPFFEKINKYVKRLTCKKIEEVGRGSRRENGVRMYKIKFFLIFYFIFKNYMLF